jgi:hypothetical protein
MTISLDAYAAKGEARIARKIVNAAIASGYSLSVHDGEEWTLHKSQDVQAVLEALATTGIDTVRFRSPEGVRVGELVLVWGNDPEGSELVADIQAQWELDLVELESFVKRALA